MLFQISSECVTDINFQSCKNISVHSAGTVDKNGTVHNEASVNIESDDGIKLYFTDNVNIMDRFISFIKENVCTIFTTPGEDEDQPFIKKNIGFCFIKTFANCITKIKLEYDVSKFDVSSFEYTKILKNESGALESRDLDTYESSCFRKDPVNYGHALLTIELIVKALSAHGIPIFDGSNDSDFKFNETFNKNNSGYIYLSPIYITPINLNKISMYNYEFKADKHYIVLCGKKGGKKKHELCSKESVIRAINLLTKFIKLASIKISSANIIEPVEPVKVDESIEPVKEAYNLSYFYNILLQEFINKYEFGSIYFNKMQHVFYHEMLQDLCKKSFEKITESVQFKKWVLINDLKKHFLTNEFLKQYRKTESHKRSVIHDLNKQKHSEPFVSPLEPFLTKHEDLVKDTSSTSEWDEEMDFDIHGVD